MELLSSVFNKVKSTELFAKDYLRVIDIDGSTAIQELDMVVCIPYLVESNTILLRYENIPSFELVRPEITKFINVMSQPIDTTPEEALKKGLLDKFGIELNEKKKLEILTPIFSNKTNTSRYHICILPLMSYDYQQIRIEDEVVTMGMKENNALINITELNNVIVYDLITRYCIDLFKKEFSLF